MHARAYFNTEKSRGSVSDTRTFLDPLRHAAFQAERARSKDCSYETEVYILLAQVQD
jgi:Cdc6-like AAA superfamily ATPase